MRPGQTIFTSFCLLVLWPCLIFSQGDYRYKISPLVGLGFTRTFSPEVGIATEIFRGSERWKVSVEKGGYVVKKYCALGQSLSAEFHFADNNGNFIIPKYSVWFHSYSVSVFTFGASALFTKENGIYVRPQAGIIFPGNKMNGLFGISYLRFKMMYGYNFFLMKNTTEMLHTICLHFYFGNNSGWYRATKNYTNEL